MWFGHVLINHCLSNWSEQTISGDFLLNYGPSGKLFDNDEKETKLSAEKLEKKKVMGAERKGDSTRIYDCFRSSVCSLPSRTSPFMMKMMVLIRGRNLCVAPFPLIIIILVRCEHFPDDNQKQLSTHKLLFVLNLYPIMMVFCVGDGGRHRARPDQKP
jgi:hypothetical protein